MGILTAIHRRPTQTVRKDILGQDQWRREAKNRLKAFRKELVSGTATVSQYITLENLLDRLMA